MAETTAHKAKLRGADSTRYIRYRYSDDPEDFGPDIGVLWGVLREAEGGQKVEPVALQFDRDAFTEEEVREWLSDHDFEVKEIEVAGRENPHEPLVTDEDDPVLADLQAQVDIARDNPSAFEMETFSEEDYPGIFADYDEDEIPTGDDPHPVTPGDETTVEEVELSEELRKLIDEREEYGEVTENVHADLRDLGPENAKVKARVKTPYSILNKLRRKRLDTLTDIAGAMIILPGHRTLLSVVGALKGGALGEVIEHENKYDMPGAYRAHHFLIDRDGKTVEIQVKTVRQFFVAKAAHTPYKNGTIDTGEMERIAALAEKADKGDEEAARQVDPLLEDVETLEKRFSDERDNPSGRERLASMSVPEAKALLEESRFAYREQRKVLTDNGIEGEELRERLEPYRRAIQAASVWLQRAERREEHQPRPQGDLFEGDDRENPEYPPIEQILEETAARLRKEFPGMDVRTHPQSVVIDTGVASNMREWTYSFAPRRLTDAGDPEGRFTFVHPGDRGQDLGQFTLPEVIDHISEEARENPERASLTSWAKGIATTWGLTAALSALRSQTRSAA